MRALDTPDWLGQYESGVYFPFDLCRLFYS